MVAARAKLMQGRSPSLQKACWHLRPFAFLAVISVTVLAAIYAAIQGNERKRRQRSSPK